MYLQLKRTNVVHHSKIEECFADPFNFFTEPQWSAEPSLGPIKQAWVDC